MWNSYEHYKQYEVQADNVEDFCKRYTKYDRHEGRGKEYADYRVNSYTEEFEKDGFTMMSHHESVTGQVVSYYNKEDKRYNG